MNCFLGIDLGTGYFKAGIFDENGSLLGLGRHRVEKRFPVFRDKETLSAAPGAYASPGKEASAGGRDAAVGCELPVFLFWDTLKCCITEAVRQAGIHPRNITALSYSSQANSFILLDGDDLPLTPFILWPDERAKEHSDVLEVLTSRADFPETTGLGILPERHSMMAKIEWFRKREPLLWKKVKSVMTLSDYLTFILTGERVSDVSTASMTALLDVPGSRWWPVAASIGHIREEQLSTPLRMGSRVGSLTPRSAELVGLSADALFFVGGLDHHMVAVGAGIPGGNSLSESTGTVLASVRYRQGYAPQSGVNTAPGWDANHFFEMAFDGNGAVALEWYQKNHAVGKTIEELLQEAESVPVGCDGLFARPRANELQGLQGFNPVGETHRDGHFVRAILESTAASLLQLTTKLDEAHQTEAVVPSGGGAKSRLWLQIKANLLNRPFWVPASGELACKGASLLCAVGMSRFGSLDEAVQKQTAFLDRILPHPAEAKKYGKWYRTYREEMDSTRSCLRESPSMNE